MKQKIWIVTIAAAAAFMVGCDKKEPSASQESASQNLDQIKKETKAVARDMEDYSFAQKAEFVKTMESHLEKIQGDLDALSAKIEDADDEVKTDAAPKVQALRDQAAQLNDQLDEVRNATESTWDSVKANSQKAFDSLKEGFQNSRQWLSDKIEP